MERSYHPSCLQHSLWSQKWKHERVPEVSCCNGERWEARSTARSHTHRRLRPHTCGQSIYTSFWAEREGEAISSSARVSTVFLLGERRKWIPASMTQTNDTAWTGGCSLGTHTEFKQDDQTVCSLAHELVKRFRCGWVWFGAKNTALFLSSDPKHMKSKAKSSKQMRKRLNREQRAEDGRRGEWNELKNCWQVRRWSHARGREGGRHKEVQPHWNKSQYFFNAKEPSDRNKWLSALLAFLS